MLADADIVAGKLALGRGYVSREAAHRIAGALQAALSQGRRTSFASAGVQLGLLPPQHAEALAHTLEHGALICRGSCGRAQPLRSVRAQETLRCVSCGGPVFVGQKPRTYMQLDVPPPRVEPPELPPAVSQTERTVVGGTFMELDVPQPTSPPKPPDETPTRVQAVDALEDAGVDWANAPTALGPALPPVPVPGGSANGPQPTDTAASGETTLKMAQTPGNEFSPFRVADDVEAEAPLGRGAGGTVLRGKRISSGETVAIKILGKPNDDDALARFKREVMIGGRLGHPGIVQVLDTGTVKDGRWAGHPYCLMEFVPGRDLDDWATEGQRDPRACAQLIARVCEAVHYAHGKGVIHRDLKPGNILVRWQDDGPVVCDFGLSKYRRDAQNTTDIPGAKTKVGVILGTPSYMSPEQARGETAIGPAADVYGLGAVLYRLLTGDAPFRGESPFETIKAVVREKPKPPSRHNPKVSPELDALVLRCLAKKPLNRFHGARALGEALLALPQ